MPQFRKKPVVVEAMRFTGHNDAEVLAFAPPASDPPTTRPCLVVSTLEGDMFADPGDWIIKGVKGEFYPCKPDIFAATYESVTEGAPPMDVTQSHDPFAPEGTQAPQPETAALKGEGEGEPAAVQEPAPLDPTPPQESAGPTEPEPVPGAEPTPTQEVPDVPAQ